jgi:hypothetical protein
MMTKVLLTMTGMLALLLTATGQFYHGGLSSSFYMPRTEYVADSTGKLLFKPGDVGFSLQAGAGYGSNFNGRSSFATYVSPAFAYNVSSRFRLKAGVSMMNTFGDPYYYGLESYPSPVMGTGTTTRVFVQGDYLLSNKFMISAAAYKDFPVFNPRAADPRFKMPESQGMILNLNYRPTRNFEINASFEYGSGSRSALNSPFYHHGTFPGYSPW